MNTATFMVYGRKKYNMNINTFWKLSYGVYIVSAWDELRPTGCIVNSIMQIQADPATIAISMSHDNYTHQCIEKTGRFAISILDVNTDPSIIGTFGFQSGKEVNKFDLVDYAVIADLPIVKAGCGYITCEVINRMETDTHTVYLGKALEADILSPGEAMTYDYYHNVIKGRSSRNAPTYIAKESSEELVESVEKKEVYQCSVCRYEYSGVIPFDELPEDYVCPICKQPKSVFYKKTS
jgi:flavin reductase (DIM6/NTAB) family NADH-FMN oxidoreductase RutF/rubredoxin